jgi:hypothetical protein
MDSIEAKNIFLELYRNNSEPWHIEQVKKMPFMPTTDPIYLNSMKQAIDLMAELVPDCPRNITEIQAQLSQGICISMRRGDGDVDNKPPWAFMECRCVCPSKGTAENLGLIFQHRNNCILSRGVMIYDSEQLKK